MTDGARNATRTVPSVCRFCHAGCAILVDIEHRNGQDRAVRVRGDRENPVYRGFTCEKGRQLPEQHHHPDRLLHSMRKRSDGTHEPIASDAVIREIADRLRDIIDAHGPRSVAIYTGTAGSRNPAARPMLNALMDAIGSPMRFDSNTIDQPGKAVAQALLGMWGAPPQDFDSADVTLLIGINPFVSMAWRPSDARPHATRPRSASTRHAPAGRGPTAYRDCRGRRSVPPAATGRRHRDRVGHVARDPHRRPRR